MYNSSIYVLFGKNKRKDWPIVASVFKDELENVADKIKKEYPDNAEAYYIVELDMIISCEKFYNEVNKICKNIYNI